MTFHQVSTAEESKDDITMLQGASGRGKQAIDFIILDNLIKYLTKAEMKRNTLQSKEKETT